MSDPESVKKPFGWKLILIGLLMMPLGWGLSYLDKGNGGLTMLALILFCVGALLGGINVGMVMVSRRSRIMAEESKVVLGILTGICALLTTAAMLVLGIGGCMMLVPFNLH